MPVDPSWNLIQDLQTMFQYEFMRNAFIGGTIVAAMAGVVGYFVVLRRLAFASEALGHGGFAGATGAVVLQQDVFFGLLVFSTLLGAGMGILGEKLRGRDVAIGAMLTFSLALGSLFLTLSSRMAGQATNILFGNILAVSPTDVRFAIAFSLLAIAGIGAMYRPLLFASLDSEVAEARGIPVRALGIAFMVLLGFAVAASVQVVGVLLIFALLILPSATAQQLTARPERAILISVVVAVACVWTGLIVGFYAPYPPSFFITATAFALYLVSRPLSPRSSRVRQARLRGVPAAVSA